MSNNLEWIKQIEYDDLITGDMKLIAERCGEDVLFSLLSNIPSIHVYLSEAPLNAARRRYIEKYYRQGNAKELAVTLNVSEYFVYKVQREIIKQRQQDSALKPQTNLFNS